MPDVLNRPNRGCNISSSREAGRCERSAREGVGASLVCFSPWPPRSRRRRWRRAGSASRRPNDRTSPGPDLRRTSTFVRGAPTAATWASINPPHAGSGVVARRSRRGRRRLCRLTGRTATGPQIFLAASHDRGVVRWRGASRLSPPCPTSRRRRVGPCRWFADGVAAAADLFVRSSADGGANVRAARERERERRAHRFAGARRRRIALYAVWRDGSARDSSSSAAAPMGATFAST